MIDFVSQWILTTNLRSTAVTFELENAIPGNNGQMSYQWLFSSGRVGSKHIMTCKKLNVVWLFVNKDMLVSWGNSLKIFICGCFTGQNHLQIASLVTKISFEACHIVDNLLMSLETSTRYYYIYIYIQKKNCESMLVSQRSLHHQWWETKVQFYNHKFWFKQDTAGKTRSFHI